ncbi:EamA family transporter [Agrobacterium vitis]|nr:EamA family transporter [Agrobacterium vitis]
MPSGMMDGIDRRSKARQSRMSTPPRATSGTTSQAPLFSGVTFGLGMMVLSVLITPLVDVFSKLATQTMPAAEISLARFFFQILFMLPVLMIRRTWLKLSWSNTRLHMIRGGVLCLSMLTFVTALRTMEVADAVAIFFVEPIILTILSGIILKEKIGWRRYLACGTGFIGAMLVVQPSFQEVGAVAFLPIIAAFCIAIFAILTRLLSRHQDPFVMQVETGCWAMVFCTIMIAIGQTMNLAMFDLVQPDLTGTIWLICTGATAAVGGVLGVFAYRAAPPSMLAPLQYLEIVTATLFGWLVFHDLPDALKWLGIAIIIGSGLTIIWRERKHASRPVSESSGPPQP